MSMSKVVVPISVLVAAVFVSSSPAFAKGGGHGAGVGKPSGYTAHSAAGAGEGKPAGYTGPRGAGAGEGKPPGYTGHRGAGAGEGKPPG